MIDKYGDYGSMNELKEYGYFIIGLKELIEQFSVIYVFMGY